MLAVSLDHDLGAATTGYDVACWPEGMTKSYFVEVDGGGGVVQECNEDNNGALVTDAACPIPG